jgi:pimeloyl-ACP methyl ester carboxylesterase
MAFEATIEIKSANPVDLFYKVYGSEHEHTKQLSSNKPTLIWLHGGPGFDHSIHEPFISSLAQDGIQVILIDQRGQGKSSDQDSPANWNLAQWGDDIFDFCNTLRITKPIVGGVSFGGAVAQSYMLKHSEQPAGIILCDTDSHIDKDRLLNTFYERAYTSHLQAGDSPEIATEKAKRVYKIAEQVFSDPTDQAVLQEHFANGIPLCGSNIYNTERPMDCILRMNVAKHYFNNELFSYDYRPEFIEKVKFPVLVMYGDKNAVHSLESAKETIAALPVAFTQAEYFREAATPVYDNEPERARNVIATFCKCCILEK